MGNFLSQRHDILFEECSKASEKFVKDNPSLFLTPPVKVQVIDIPAHPSNVQESFNSSTTISGNIIGTNINSKNTQNNTFNINIAR